MFQCDCYNYLNKSGFGITKYIDTYEPNTDYNFRLCVINPKNVKSEFCDIVSVKTLSIKIFSGLLYSTNF